METPKINSMLNANKIFILCAEEDKDYVIALQNNLRARKLNVWSMFKDDGNYSVGIGDDHLQVAISELKQSCIVVMLISEHTIAKGSDKNSFIFQEINNFHSITASCKSYIRKLVPICIGKDHFNSLPESWMPFGINSFKISSTLKSKKTANGEEIDELKLNQIGNEISNIYYECMVSNYGFIQSNKYKLVVLGNKLMQSEDTVVKTISDDIRQTDENDSDSLSAIHIITNEIGEYDCNAYSLMIISANLLGTPDGGYYDPARKGVKYYYYCPQQYLESKKEDYQARILSFLRRDKAAITYAESSIRSHYVVENGIISYLKQYFNHSNINTIFESFSIPKSYKEGFVNELEQYDGDFYDSDTETILFPNSFLEWLFGRDVRFNVEVFEFIDKLASFFRNTHDHNVAMVEEFVNIEKMLERIYDFHTYLHGKNSVLTPHKFKGIAKKIIGLSNDQNNTLIERWVIDRDGSTEWENQDIDEVVNKAMENISFIPIKETDDFVICNSFAVYDHKDRITGKTSCDLVWYSTAHNHVQTDERINNKVEREMLVVLNEEADEHDCNVVRETLKYLKSIGLIDKYIEF